MNNLFLFAHIAGTPVAIRASEVDAVVRLSSFSSIPGMPPHIAGLAALRSRVLTIIDVAALIDPETITDRERPFAIVSDIAGHSYGLLVDHVSDIWEVTSGVLPVRGRIDPRWRPFVAGVVMNEETPCLLVTIDNLIENVSVAQAA